MQILNFLSSALRHIIPRLNSLRVAAPPTMPSEVGGGNPDAVRLLMTQNLRQVNLSELSEYQTRRVQSLVGELREIVGLTDNTFILTASGDTYNFREYVSNFRGKNAVPESESDVPENYDELSEEWQVLKDILYTRIDDRREKNRAVTASAKASLMEADASMRRAERNLQESYRIIPPR